MGIVCGLLGIINKGVGNAWGIFGGWDRTVMLRLLIVVGYCLDRSLSWFDCASIIRPFKQNISFVATKGKERIYSLIILSH